jgi:hypothetical protein
VDHSPGTVVATVVACRTATSPQTQQVVVELADIQAMEVLAHLSTLLEMLVQAVAAVAVAQADPVTQRVLAVA